VSATFGQFHLTLDGATLTIHGPNGPLVEGLPPSNDVGTPQSDNDDAPPMTGFAVRDVATAYTMKYGSFSIIDTANAAWRVARSATWNGSGAIDLTDGSGRIASITFSQGLDDGHLVADVEPGDGPERRFSWGFACAPSDHFAGFGAQTWGTDGRKETIPIFVTEEGVGKNLTTDNPTPGWPLVGRRHSTGFPLPEFLSRRGFMAVAETDRLSTFALCSERDDVARMELALPVKVHFFYGPSPKDAMTRMTAKFGRPRVPPAFAFAPWNDAIFGSASVRQVAQKIRSSNIPSSVIWTEDWRGGVWNGNHYALKEEYDVDRTLYPDFETVAQELHAAGFKWLVYFNTFVEQTSKAWPETQPNGYLIKGADAQPYMFEDAKLNQASLVDLSNSAAVDWVVGKLKAAIALGADGWMGDYSEWLPTDAVLAGGSGLDLHNRYPLLWQQAQRRALDEAFAADQVERLSFVRSGWLGSPPLVDAFWPGDQRTDFEVDDGMPNVMPMGIGAAIGGISTYGSDIGGYQNATNGPTTKELFFRWTALGAWSPVMRTHHGSFPKLNWNFQSDDETLAHWARYARLHVSLAPYFRALAQQAHDTGVAIWRGLFVEFPDDEKTWPIADEVMVGPSLLVAPVQTMGATSRDVYLPAGAWFPWSGGASASGAQSSVAVPIGEIAVYARAGSIVPAYPDGVETLTVEPSSAPNASSAKDDRVVYVFAGAPASFTESMATGGFAYALDAGSGADIRYNGALLAACATPIAAPCVESVDHAVTAHVTGPGVLLTPAAKVTVTGGAASRALTMMIRY
jgi:alpha-glucosidase (family GH31 glycosyl hydrolase)